MKKINISIIAAIMMSACCDLKNENQESENMQTKSELIFDKGERIDNPNFTGNAWLNNLIKADSLNKNAVGSVIFEPGARTSWHSHPAGQIILAIDGVGYYQEKGKQIKVIRKGEVIKCPHNIFHWHGASPDSMFIQIAITGRENGPTVWLEPETDEK